MTTTQLDRLLSLHRSAEQAGDFDLAHDVSVVLDHLQSKFSAPGYRFSKPRVDAAIAREEGRAL